MFFEDHMEDEFNGTLLGKTNVTLVVIPKGL